MLDHFSLENWGRLKLLDIQSKPSKLNRRLHFLPSLALSLLKFDKNDLYLENHESHHQTFFWAVVIGNPVGAQKFEYIEHEDNLIKLLVVIKNWGHVLIIIISWSKIVKSFCDRLSRKYMPVMHINHWPLQCSFFAGKERCEYISLSWKKAAHSLVFLLLVFCCFFLSPSVRILITSDCLSLEKTGILELIFIDS